MKTDARVRYTKMRIREAFLQCLREKAVNQITVKELCERAEINRATFYTHYSDAFDLLEQLEQECLEQIEGIIQDRRDSGEGILITILKGIQNPQGTVVLLASPHGDPGFTEKIAALYHRSFAPEMAKWLPGAPPEEQLRVYRFLAGGCGSMIAAWMEAGMPGTAEEMAASIQTLCGKFIETCNTLRPGAGEA